MYCSICGCEVPEGADVCENCGARLKPAEYEKSAEKYFEGSSVKQGARDAWDKTKGFVGAAKDAADTAVKGLGLEGRQKTNAILAVCSALCFLLAFGYSGTLYAILSLAAALLLSAVCIKKESFPSFLYALSVSIYVLRFLILDLRVIFRISSYYRFTVWNGVQRFSMYAAAAVIWILLYKKSAKPLLLCRAALCLCAYLEVYSLIRLFGGSGFKHFLFHIGVLCFWAAVISLLLELDVKTAASPGEYAGKAKSLALVKAPKAYAKRYCPHCGSGISEGALFCNVCGASLKGREAKEKTRSCARCGNPLEEWASFCENCGAPQPGKAEPSPVESLERSAVKNTGFMGLSEYVIDEKVSPFKFANVYKVYDVQGNVVGGVQQVNISAGAKAARVLLGNSVKGMQPFQYDILDADGKVLATVRREGIKEGMQALRHILVLNESGSVIGSIKFMGGWTTNIEVCDAENNILCAIKGDWKGWNFVISDSRGVQIGEINKKWSGLAREFFTTADRYRVSLTGAYGGVRKVVVSAAAITLDMVMHEF